MQNLGISIKIGSALESKGFNAAQKELSKIQSLNQSVLKSTLTPKVNLSPLNKLKSALNGIKAQVESLRNKDLELKVQGKIDSFKSSFVEKAAIGASIAMPVKAAIDFESSMADVKKVVDFESNEELNAFGAEIRKLSQTIPLLPTELAKITASGGQLGIAKQDLMGFTTLVAKIGTAFDMSAENAGDTMAKIMNVYGLNLKEMEGLGDTINHISDNSAAKASEITEVLNRIGGTAKVMGLSAENAAALGSAFIAMGKAPEVAGTAINSFFTKLLAPEEQSASFRKALEEIGLSAEELKDSIQNNPQKGIEDFLQTLTEVEKSEQMGILSNLFGAEFGDDMALLVSGINNYKKAVELANDKNKVGSLQREFETRAATTENALTLLKSSVLNLGIGIGSILLPPLNAIIGVINPIINGFAALCETFPKISGVVVGAVAAFGSFIVASAGLGFVFNLIHLNILKALPYFGLFKSAIIGSVAWLRAKNLGLLLVKAQLGATMIATKLYGIATLGLSKALAFGGAALKVFGSVLSFIGKSILLNPIFLIGALLVGGAYLIYKHWTPIKEIFSTLWDKIKIGANVAWESFKTLFKWTPLGLIIQGFSAVTEYFSSLFATWVGMFSGVINKIGSAISSVKGFFGFGEKESSIKAQDSLALQPAQITPIEIKPISQNPKTQAQNINVAFTGGIQVQTTDGKIPENSQLQRDIQREVEAALKKSKESERNRTLSDIDF
ncbi:phage tail tape measure protein [uncultured Helicobacter sp.]|uniref:phage tail tape measure protein n=1 Tax=uncultured Helicobacter sp. TaxID=175537 RepID=UPI00262EA382|nr:phage tail tape measure protein [uncultured Helicobacter sp.]